MDMNSALACLRRELAGMQTQDKNLLRQLLTLRASVLSLKADMVIERERAEMEEFAVQSDFSQYATRSHAVVTKVEIIDEISSAQAHRRNQQDTDKPIQIKHAKQDSGFLTDEEEEFEAENDPISALPMTRVVASRSYSVVATTTTESVSRERSNSREYPNATKRKASLPGRVERPRTFTAPEIMRPSSAGERDNKHSQNNKVAGEPGFKFPEYKGRVRTFSVPEETPFYRREIHRGSVHAFSNTPKTKPRMVKAASSMDLRSESYNRSQREAKNMQPYKVYRSVSQISLV